MLSIKEQIAEADRLAEQAAYDEALERYNGVMKEPRLRSDDFFQLSFKIGGILTAGKRFAEARDVYAAAIAKGKQLKKYQRVSELWHASALNEVEAGCPDKAIEAFRNELDMSSSRNENYFFQLSTNYYEQGNVFLSQGDAAESKLYFELALAFAETDGIAVGEARALDGLARYYVAVGDPVAAANAANTALGLYNDAKDKGGAQRMRRQLKKLKETR